MMTAKVEKRAGFGIGSNIGRKKSGKTRSYLDILIFGHLDILFKDNKLPVEEQLSLNKISK
ncbi:hypothetical protein [Chitinophaga varians]|uniref:hypothetical protein n=1 Tax=Chitinophaga varians TaxID=2202339 RepID=UPI00165F1405|nr:hypothetical protein [Chitinophaga varians]MBC9912027.1 hypothetical protein [Chitinophaga varians]